MQVCTYAGMHVCRYAVTQVYRYAGMFIFKYLGMQYLSIQVNSQSMKMQTCEYASVQVCQ